MLMLIVVVCGVWYEFWYRVGYGCIVVKWMFNIKSIIVCFL